MDFSPPFRHTSTQTHPRRLYPSCCRVNRRGHSSEGVLCVVSYHGTIGSRRLEQPLDVRCYRLFNPFRSAVPFWGQTGPISNSLSPRWGCGPKRGYAPRRENDRRQAAHVPILTNKKVAPCGLFLAIKVLTLRTGDDCRTDICSFFQTDICLRQSVGRLECVCHIPGILH